MKRVLVPIADGFEEIETMTVVDVLRRANAEVVLAGLTKGPLKGSRDVSVFPDIQLDAVSGEFDMIVIPGGQPGVDHLRAEKRVLALLNEMKQADKWIAAICAAALVLRDAGLTKGLRFTCYPGVEDMIEEGHFDSSRVVMDGKIITSRGPGTSMEFSLKLVGLLYGKDKEQELGEQVLALLP